MWIFLEGYFPNQTFMIMIYNKALWSYIKMSKSRAIAIEYKFESKLPAQFSIRLPHPGFVPTSYRIVSICFSGNNGAVGPVIINHSRLGVLGSFDGSYSDVVPVNMVPSLTIDNTDMLDLHSSDTTISLTQRGLVHNIDGNFSMIIECRRKGPK